MTNAFEAWPQIQTRGPWRLMLVRPYARKPGFIRTEWLQGSVLEKEDVGEEVRALLMDPRDEIREVSVWSLRDEQFVMTFAKKDVEHGG